MSKLFVIGGSAGSLKPLQGLVAQLPADFDAPLLVVMHVGNHDSMLPDILSRRGKLPAAHAVDGQTLEPGRIVVAPPDRHLLVDGSRVTLSSGAKEHHSRPAIDPLFRSAALAHGAAVVGVILSGMLDDGTAGLQAIEQCGGVSVVQDPADAVEPSMPQSAVRHARVDHRSPASAIGSFRPTGPNGGTCHDRTTRGAGP